MLYCAVTVLYLSGMANRALRAVLCSAARCAADWAAIASLRSEIMLR